MNRENFNDWLKDQYLQAFDDIQQIVDTNIEMLKKNGYKVEFMDAQAGVYSYTDSKGELQAIPCVAKVQSIPALLIHTAGKQPLYDIWTEAIKDKDNQILALYIPAVPTGVFFYDNIKAPYITLFDVITINNK